MCIAFGLTPAVALGELPEGKSRHEVDLNGVRLMFLSYKPRDYDGRAMVLSFHGSERNPAIAREAMIPLADAENVIVIAPKFDKARFPRWAYQLGGIAERIVRDGRVRFDERAPEHWTGNIVLDLVEHVRREEGRADLPYYLIGHSGGGQFLGRFAAFVPNEARRIVLANPGTYIFPDREQAFPYGFGGLSAALSGSEQVRRYVAAPITILLGTEDLQRRGLNKSRGAERQGYTRYERGINAFSAARELATERNWPFGWRIVEVPGVAHSSRDMYGGAEARVALFGDDATSPRMGCEMPRVPHGGAGFGHRPAATAQC